MIDEVMRLVDGLPIPCTAQKMVDQSVIMKQKLEDQNFRIEKLKVKIKKLTDDGTSHDHVYALQRQLNDEFVKLDEMLKTKLEWHTKSMQPTSIIHLPTTEDEDNLPPIMLYAPSDEAATVPAVLRKPKPSHQRVQSPQVVPSHDHSVPLQQRKAEEKFQKIQKKLLDLCCNDIQSRSIKQSSSNLDDDIKKQFDNLYSELRVLERELFHDDPDFDSFDHSDKQTVYETLKRQNAMLLQQGEHFQVLFKEQQLEIENYRRKYMETLQNVMEQHIRITSMETQSKSSEKKTSDEIVRMKNNLRKKLDHFAPLSNMLETCNNKLIYTVKRKAELEQNYEDICDELRLLKKELAQSSAGTYKAKCEALGDELKKAKDVNEFNAKRIKQMQLQLQQAKSELERVKVKSNRTIKATMKKCDFLRNELKSRINQLEIELAQSRAIAVANSK